MLRAVGTTRGQVRGMVVAEALLLAAVGVVFGIAGGVAMGYALVYALNATMFVMPYYFPWGGIVVAVDRRLQLRAARVDHPGAHRRQARHRHRAPLRVAQALRSAAHRGVATAASTLLADMHRSRAADSEIDGDRTHELVHAACDRRAGRGLRRPAHPAVPRAAQGAPAVVDHRLRDVRGRGVPRVRDAALRRLEPVHVPLLRAALGLARGGARAGQHGAGFAQADLVAHLPRLQRRLLRGLRIRRVHHAARRRRARQPQALELRGAWAARR